MATTTYSCVIQVTEKCRTDDGNEFWLITSDDLPGLLLGGRDLNALRSDIPLAIGMLFRENYGMDVNVVKAMKPSVLASGIPESEYPPAVAWTAILQAA